MLGYCDGWLFDVRAVRRVLSVVCILRRRQFYTKVISSTTAGQILMKLTNKDSWVTLFKTCSNCSGPLHMLFIRSKYLF